MLSVRTAYNDLHNNNEPNIISMLKLQIDFVFSSVVLNGIIHSQCSSSRFIPYYLLTIKCSVLFYHFSFISHCSRLKIAVHNNCYRYPRVIVKTAFSTLFPMVNWKRIIMRQSSVLFRLCCGIQIGWDVVIGTMTFVLVSFHFFLLFASINLSFHSYNRHAIVYLILSAMRNRSV